jgi:hypothetical protein
MRGFRLSNLTRGGGLMAGSFFFTAMKSRSNKVRVMYLLARQVTVVNKDFVLCFQ